MCILRLVMVLMGSRRPRECLEFLEIGFNERIEMLGDDKKILLKLGLKGVIDV